MDLAWATLAVWQAIMTTQYIRNEHLTNKWESRVRIGFIWTGATANVMWYLGQRSLSRYERVRDTVYILRVLMILVTVSYFIHIAAKASGDAPIEDARAG